MFTIFDFKQSIDGLNITMVGDLKHGRTVHSLAKLIARYEGAGHHREPGRAGLAADARRIIVRLRAEGVAVNETEDLTTCWRQRRDLLDARPGRTLCQDRAEYDAIKDGFIMTPPVLAQAKPMPS
jgi:hypothetical protein